MIRLPLALRAYLVIFTCIWCGFVLPGLIAAVINGPPAIVILLPMLAFGLTLGYRTFRLSVTLGSEELLVRNFSRTQRVIRAEVEGFRMGDVSRRPFGRTIYVLLRDGTVLPLDVAEHQARYGFGKLENQMQSLQQWLAQG